MIPVARRLLVRNRGGSIVTIAGVAATISLLLFLFAVHDGVKEGSTRYVRTAGVDIWVSQKNSDNILKSSSFLPASLAERIAGIDGVATASSLVRVITKADIAGRRSSTLFILGFDPATGLGAPSTIVEGTAALRPGEIVLDRAFSSRYGLLLDDTIEIQSKRFRVAGISEGTNALVSQFAFTSIDDAASLLGLQQTASFILVRIDGTQARSAVAARIRAAFSDLAVHEADAFTRFHYEEMQSGVLPVFAAATFFAAAAGAFLVALMLYSSVLERREDFATLKALGAGHAYLVRIVVGQALIVTTAGCLIGGLLVAALTPVILRLVPAIALEYSPQMIVILPAALLIGATAAIVPLRLLRRIYPAEVFRA